MHFHARPRGRADAQPVQPQALPQVIQFMASSGRNSRKRLLLAAIEHVALVLGDDQRQARDLGREVAQLDPAKVGERDVAVGARLSAARLLISASMARISL
jgi:hypothetical protein